MNFVLFSLRDLPFVAQTDKNEVVVDLATVRCLGLNARTPFATSDAVRVLIVRNGSEMDLCGHSSNRSRVDRELLVIEHCRPLRSYGVPFHVDRALLRYDVVHKRRLLTIRHNKLIHENSLRSLLVQHELLLKPNRQVDDA